VTTAQYLNYAAATFSVAAGVLWFLSARVKTGETFNIVVVISVATWDGLACMPPFRARRNCLTHDLIGLRAYQLRRSSG
jgi:hypothetical protein